ncbi:uncharacterized protein LOC105421009 [Amborella trichopoda]|uniref:uncharacterized protein LOC105421009 n=1 Tax=Amborella trichopoda TaxID=13333 RepID=UPI0005D37038|nr:uncharacterized protein LOC105421009 [Amborella trichopoda]|eukprot:XP_011625093.1 uncharacterized protein LOC105421009 [Amborella trichopoda]
METDEAEGTEATAPGRGTDVDVAFVPQEFSAPTEAGAMTQEGIVMNDAPEHQGVADPVGTDRGDEGVELFVAEVLAIEDACQMEETTAEAELSGEEAPVDEGQGEEDVPELANVEVAVLEGEEQGELVSSESVEIQVEVPVDEGQCEEADIEESGQVKAGTVSGFEVQEALGFSIVPEEPVAQMAIILTSLILEVEQMEEETQVVAELKERVPDPEASSAAYQAEINKIIDCF